MTLLVQSDYALHTELVTAGGGCVSEVLDGRLGCWYIAFPPVREIGSAHHTCHASHSWQLATP